MNKLEVVQWLGSIYTTLNRLELKSTTENVKSLSAIYYEIERVIGVLQEEGESVNEQ